MRLVSYYTQYGQSFGKWVTFLHLLKMVFMAWFAGLFGGTGQNPEILQSVDRWLSPAPFYGLWFWFNQQLPTLKMSKDTKRDISAETIRRPKVDTGWETEEPKTPQAAVLQKRTRPTVHQTWRQRPAAAHTGTRDWAKSFNEGWVDTEVKPLTEES